MSKLFTDKATPEKKAHKVHQAPPANHKTQSFRNMTLLRQTAIKQA